MGFSLSGLISGIVEGVPKLLGNSSIKQRVGLGALFAGSAYGGSKLLEHFATQQRAYYGEDRYNSYYGNGLESLTSSLKMAGYGMAGLAAMSRDPITRVMNSYKYRKAWASTKKWSDLMNFQLPRSRASSYSASDIAALRKAPRAGIFTLSMAATALGASPTGNLLGPSGQAIATYGGLGIGAMGLGWAGRHIIGAGGIAGLAATVAGGYAGYLAGSQYNNIAEGNIIDFSATNGAGVSKMNFSTAGLVQALHRNNRRY